MPTTSITDVGLDSETRFVSFGKKRGTGGKAHELLLHVALKVFHVALFNILFICLILLECKIFEKKNGLLISLSPCLGIEKTLKNVCSVIGFPVDLRETSSMLLSPKDFLSVPAPHLL